MEIVGLSLNTFCVLLFKIISVILPRFSRGVVIFKTLGEAEKCMKMPKKFNHGQYVLHFIALNKEMCIINKVSIVKFNTSTLGYEIFFHEK